MGFRLSLIFEPYPPRKSADTWGVEVVLSNCRHSHDCAGRAEAQAEVIYWQRRGYEAQVLKNGAPLATRPDLADTKPLPKPAA